MTMTAEQLAQLYANGHECITFTTSLIVLADCFEWMRDTQPASIHAIVTDPPYGLREYDESQLTKRANGTGGVWRIPPGFDGHQRSPLPRFTALSAAEMERIRLYFREWGDLALRILRPGGHVFLAAHSLLSQIVFAAVAESGFEFRGQIIRLVRTLRGGNRPKGAETEYPSVSTMPRGCYEPWGLFRKPLPEDMTVGDCLRKYQTGGLRRQPDGTPPVDIIPSGRTPRREREIANHPTLKPQAFLRQIVRASLPLGEGVVLDPFAGSGSTLAAAEAEGYACVGVERLRKYFAVSRQAVPALARLRPVDRTEAK